MIRSLLVFCLLMYLGSASAYQYRSALRGASQSKCLVLDIEHQSALNVQEYILGRLGSDADHSESILYTHCSKESIRKFHTEYKRQLKESILLQMEIKR